jgi:hypothetical protein
MAEQENINDAAMRKTTQSVSKPTKMNKVIDFAGIGVSLGAASLLVLHLSKPDLKIDAIGLSLIVLAMLPWLLPLLGRHLASGKILGQEFTFLQGKVEDQGKEIKNQREIIQLIYEALRRSLTKYEYKHLVELDSDAPCHCQYSDFLQNEMIRLCQHGYVSETFDCAVWKMKEKGNAVFNLKDFFRITDDGRKYLDLLRKLQMSVTSVGQS